MNIMITFAFFFLACSVYLIFTATNIFTLFLISGILLGLFAYLFGRHLASYAMMSSAGNPTIFLDNVPIIGNVTKIGYLNTEIRMHDGKGEMVLVNIPNDRLKLI